MGHQTTMAVRDGKGKVEHRFNEELLRRKTNNR